MSGIPVLTATGKGIAAAWENSLLILYRDGCEVKTQYDKPSDPPSKDATMLIVAEEPLSEPMIHRAIPCGLDDLQEYVMEVCEGIKDHFVRNPDDPTDTRWQYTYHQRLFKYDVPGRPPIDQIELMCQQLAKTPFTRRSQAVTWKVWEDSTQADPACLQSVWCRITPAGSDNYLSMNVRLRSNDAYKANMMNMFAFVQLQQLIANRIAELSGTPLKLGRYCHLADSYHIYGSDMKEFEGRFLKLVRQRLFEDRTYCYGEVRDLMLSSRDAILAKVKRVGRT